MYRKPYRGLALLLGACSSSPTGPADTGSIQIVVATSGLGVIPTEYLASIDSGAPRSIAAGGSIAGVGVPTGIHRVWLTGVPLQCTSDWYVPQEVTVAAGQTSVVRFQLHCDPPIGPGIVFSQINAGVAAGLQMVQPDGSGQHQFPGTDRSDYAPAISPGGTRIAFLRPFSGLMVMNADGTGTQLLTSAWAGQPDWAPDGTRLVFQSGRTLVVISADGRSSKVVWSMSPGDPADVVQDPRWSPDGKMVVFSYGREIDVLDLSTGMVRNLRPPNNESYGIKPVWSPDGTRIAYLATPWQTPGMSFTLHLINADGTEDTALPAITGLDRWGLAWSPDGRQVAFVYGVYPDGYDIGVILVDGTSMRNLTHSPATSEYSPTWVP